MSRHRHRRHHRLKLGQLLRSRIGHKDLLSIVGKYCRFRTVYNIRCWSRKGNWGCTLDPDRCKHSRQLRGAACTTRPAPEACSPTFWWVGGAPQLRSLSVARTNIASNESKKLAWACPCGANCQGNTSRGVLPQHSPRCLSWLGGTPVQGVARRPATCFKPRLRAPHTNSDSLSRKSSSSSAPRCVYKNEASYQLAGAGSSFTACAWLVLIPSWQHREALFVRPRQRQQPAASSEQQQRRQQQRAPPPSLPLVVRGG
jgi:hypothetical protein